MFPKFETPGMKYCVNLLVQDSNAKMSDKEVKFSFGMSKMSVKDEVKNKESYEVMKLVEFLEFIGRCASAKYILETEMPLADKISLLLDDIFPVFGLKRKDANEAVEDGDTSEESVIIQPEEID
jgi:hypothetical protein